MGCNVKKIHRYHNRTDTNNNSIIIQKVGGKLSTSSILFQYYMVAIVIVLLFYSNTIQYDKIISIPTILETNNIRQSNVLLLFASSFVLQPHQPTQLSLHRQLTAQGQNNKHQFTIPFLKVHRHGLSSSKETDMTTNTIATGTSNTSIDPIVSNWIMMIEDEIENDLDFFGENNGDMIHNTTFIRMSNSEIQEASVGISIWKNTLLKGRLPNSTDFDYFDKEQKKTNNKNNWPNDDDLLLWDIVINSMIEKQLPRFILHHTQDKNVVLRNILQFCIQYKYTKQI